MSRRLSLRRAVPVGLALVLTGALASVGLVVGAVDGTGPAAPERGTRSTADAADGRALAQQFLDEYVEPDGRVVRRDQGGDTVSEGQAYAMLLAVAAGREDVFGEVWDWSVQHLRRPDGLLSWQWRDGAVVDPESAADADLDAARALVLAGERFEHAGWAGDGRQLAAAVLREETVVVPQGRVLTAGTWVDAAPWSVNPSYASPVAATLLAEATQDPRWREVRAGDRAVVLDLLDGGRLPPDWARLERDGGVRPTGGPGGQSLRFAYDAARTPLRFAEACDPASREVASRVRGVLTHTEPGRAVYDLAGSPQTGNTHPLAMAALAAAHAAAGDEGAARDALSAAVAAQQEAPTYYGGAWLALGHLLLEDDVLGGCPPLAGQGDVRPRHAAAARP